MKKLLSILLMIVMMLSMSVQSFAGYSTPVTYKGTCTNAYEVTVPATLQPGGSGSVSITGTWPSYMSMDVTAPNKVTLTNDLDSGTNELDVNFPGIFQYGNNKVSVSGTETISVSEISNALFGTWTGTIVYNVAATDHSSSFSPVFAENSWEDIIAAVENDEVHTAWSIGDSKTMDIGGYEYTVVIIGKDHDTYSDGSGTAPLTFQLLEPYKEPNTSMGALNLYGFGIHNSSDNNVGWTGCRMRTHRLSEFLALMPQEVQNAIKEVDKVSLASMDGTLETTSDTLFLLSEIEVYGDTTSGYPDGGTQYEYFRNGGPMIKHDIKGRASDWWLRSLYMYSYQSYLRVTSDGRSASMMATNDAGAAFAFCF